MNSSAIVVAPLQVEAPTSLFAEPSTTLEGLQVILKTIERCNLACPYCYYFFHGDESYKARPPSIKHDVIEDVAKFLAVGISELSLESLTIVFHGGEPLMQKKSAFDKMCQHLRDELGDLVKLRLSVQTNGTLIDEEWIALFEKHKVSVGVSIDGPAWHHDKLRYDKKKRGSHATIVEGMKMLKAAADEKRIKSAGTLSVASYQIPMSDVFRHLHDDLDVKSMGFLLPDRPHDGELEAGETIESYGDSLNALFDEWIAVSDTVSVREIEHVTDYFQLRKNAARKESDDAPVEARPGRRLFNQIVVIQSNGEISLDDSLIPALAWRNAAPKGHIKSTRLREFFSLPVFGEIHSAMTNPPDACRECEWLKVCRGGALENRYSKEAGFNNPSVYCGALKKFYGHVIGKLVESGYPQEFVSAKLKQEAFEYSGESVF